MKASRTIVSFLFTAAGIATGMLSKPKPVTAISFIWGKSSASSESIAPSPSTVTTDPVATALATLLHHRDFKQLAEAGTLIRNLDRNAMIDLLNRLEDLRTTEADRLLVRLMADWTRRDPEGATAWIRPRLDHYAADPFSFNFLINDFGPRLVEAWLENAPDLALDYVSAHPGTALADMILFNAVQRVRRESTVKALALLQAYPAGKGRDEAMDTFFDSWVQDDKVAALGGAMSLPTGPQRDYAIGTVLAFWVQQNTAEALAHFETIASSNPVILPVLVSKGAKENPLVIAQWLEKQSPEMLAKSGGFLVGGWAETDPAAAFRWALAHGVSPSERPFSSRSGMAEIPSSWRALTDFTNSPPFEFALREKPDEALAWLKSVPAGPERNRLIESAISIAGNRPDVQALYPELPSESAGRTASRMVAQFALDPIQQEKFAATLPPGPVREAAWQAIGMNLREPLSLEPGPDRDAMLGGMVLARRELPENSWKLMTQIEDPQLRLQAWDDLALYLWAYPYHHALLKAWLELPDMPEEWKRPWRR